MTRYIIVDDEAPGRANLRLALQEQPGWQLQAECDSAAAARDALARAPADVVFLDIQMPRESGLELARELGRQPAPPLIIFVTAYNTHAVDAFEVHALDYLLKPIDDRRLAQAIERANAMLGLRQHDAYRAALHGYAAATHTQAMDSFHVRSVGNIEQVRVRDVLWLQAAGNYVELHLAQRTVLHRLPLSRVEQLLRPDEFLRVHRTAIVRRDQVRRLSVVGDGRHEVTLACGAQLAVSARHLQDLKACLGFAGQ
ncbi:two-component system LytT family response regulator [Duganella sp. 1224]|uniref:LytR/AlgR family response regulator transcription factor n=1 Tax=Duganella sp. 1224 TaxID=2587052 RepID=UPI00181EC2E8|nr:LytTR family DNA-binding domain-containing protein [Duganella sp. 1224]NYE63204.1 two-component system LytT family response regulator [Duganella sp. 1224]